MGIGVRLHDLRDEYSMFVMAFEKISQNDTDAHLTFFSWRRIDDTVIPARGKVSGSYANSALIKTDANRAGFDEAIVLDRMGTSRKVCNEHFHGARWNFNYTAHNGHIS